MRAAAQEAIELVEVEEVPEPALRPSQIKVKIAYAGICGTESDEGARQTLTLADLAADEAKGRFFYV